MSVEVRLPTLLRRHAGGQSTVTASGTTIAEVIGDLSAQFPELGSQLLAADGSAHKFLNVYLNDDDIRFLQQFDTPIKAGDSITILPAVAGGAI